MKPANHALRAHLRAVGRAKEQAAVDELAEHRRLSIAERILAAARHCDATLAVFPPDPSERDDEAEVWARVRRHLESHGA